MTESSVAKALATAQSVMARVKIAAAESDLSEAFPDVPCGIRPFGERVVVQIRSPKRKTKGGIILTDDSRDTEKWNTQIAKVIAYGPTAFKNRTTLDQWPEGDWCQPGEFVRVPKYGGDRWEVPYGDGDDKAMFVIFKDLDLVGLVEGDPLDILAYI